MIKKMQIKTTILFLSFLFIYVNNLKAVNYYIRTDGNDSNTGLSNTPSAAWKTINTVLYGYANWGGYPGGSQGVPMLPGDTLWINDGTYIESGYSNTGLKIDGINGSNNNRFFVKAVHKWAAKLELSSNYNSFNIYNSKGVTFDGLDIYNPMGSTNIYSGLVINFPSEFVTIRNCKLHNFGLGGVGGNGDNIIIEKNEVYDNSTRNPGNGSGINFYHPKKVGVASNTLAGGYGHIIRENLVHDNYCSLYYTNGNPPTDGNGIIIDDFNFTQNTSGTPYLVPTLIENNVCFKNGGSGIRVYDSSNVTVRNNTCYYNSWVTATFPSGSGDYPSGDIGVSCEATKGNNIKVVNNLCISDPSLPVSNNGIGVGNAITNALVTNNYTNKLFFTAGGSANVIGNAPQFVNATTNVLTANFRLLNSSPAINIGLNFNAASTDYDGTARPQNGTVDAGSFEYVGAVLPLQLIDFKGVVKNNKNILIWEVANVKNVKGFEIERSKDGIRFEKIGFVGESDITNYNFEDLDGAAYYRLKIVDYDGYFEYSKIIFLTQKEKKNTILVYPTLVQNTLIINTFNQKIKTATIFNTKGQIIKIFQNIENELNVQDLPKGVYFLALEIENQMNEVKRFIKM
jgi:parallel beta-helix repeat protein